MIGNVPLLEVKLVEQRLAIKEVVEGLCAHLEQAGAASQEAPAQPAGNPACGTRGVGACKSEQVILIASTERTKRHTIFFACLLNLVSKHA